VVNLGERERERETDGGREGERNGSYAAFAQSLILIIQEIRDTSTCRKTRNSYMKEYRKIPGLE
jgi:hypothetical protein